MFQYFLTPENQLPSGVGFSMFGPLHLMVLLVLTAWSVGFLIYLKKQPEKRQNRWMLGLAWGMIVSEVLKDAILVAIGAFSVGYLPLHLCSLSMFVCCFYSLRPYNRSCGQILYSICFPGALCALLFPDWTAFPLLHFQSIHSFILHMVLVQFSLFPLVSRRARPGLSGVWKGMAFVVAAAIPVAGLNRLLGTNYMFLRRASKGSPLEFLSALPGGTLGYLAGFFLLALAVVFLLNLPFVLLDHRKQREK